MPFVEVDFDAEIKKHIAAIPEFAMLWANRHALQRKNFEIEKAESSADNMQKTHTDKKRM